MRKGDYGELSATARRLRIKPQVLHSRRRRQDGLCVYCPTPRSPESATYCDEHLEAYRAWVRQREADRLAAGRCVKCGLKSDGYRRCQRCRQQAQAARRRRP